MRITIRGAEEIIVEWHKGEKPSAESLEEALERWVEDCKNEEDEQ